ncbi:MAG TPA: hypothetical protein VGV68_07860 [Terriglobia bacterium]|nr:hypothetical protein [Terriglobia bacterium]
MITRKNVEEIVQQTVEKVLEKQSGKPKKNPPEVTPPSGSKADLQQQLADAEEYAEALRDGLSEVVDKVADLQEQFLEDEESGDQGE